MPTSPSWLTDSAVLLMESLSNPVQLLGTANIGINANLYSQSQTADSHCLQHPTCEASPSRSCQAVLASMLCVPLYRSFISQIVLGRLLHF